MHYNGFVQLAGETVAIIGAGQVGRALFTELQSTNTCTLIPRLEADITDFAALEAALSKVSPSLIFHTAAMTKVNECERDPASAYAVNAQGTANVARAAEKLGGRLVYFSTDYVFPGKRTGEYVESETAGPLNVYGKTKLEGEGIAAGLPDSIIIRTAQVFAPYGRNFPLAALANYRERGAVRVVGDEFATPTYAPHFARAVASLIPLASGGIYHLRGPEALSYYDFTVRIFAHAGLPDSHVARISARDLNLPAPRPRRAVLGMSRYLALGLEQLPSLDDAIRSFISQAGISDYTPEK